MKSPKVLIIFCFFALMFGISIPGWLKAEDQALLNAFDASLRFDLLYPYYPNAGIDPSIDQTALDDSDGGFVEDRSSTWALQQDSYKWIVAQARYTWMAAKASQFYANDPSQADLYLQSAAVGFAFLQKMWGYDYGGGNIGIALVVDPDGSNGRLGFKGNYIVYGHAFSIYAAAAYYAASGEQAALDFAIDVYNFINGYAYDSQFGGYYDNSWSTNKTIETNLHMFEALIELYQDMPPSHSLRSEVASHITELLAHLHDDAIHCDTDYETDCFAYLVMNRDWSPYSNSISFGHDAEMAMLMEKALVVLEQDPSTYLTKIKNMVDFLFTHSGYRSDGALYYTGTYNNGNVSVTDNQLQWWPQGEGLGAVCLMRKLFPNDPFYSDIINRSWNFIDSDVIDHTNNGWVRQAGQMNIAKASEWHANYHSGRALMNCLDWLSDHCEDGIQNYGEEGVDCGGSCPACVMFTCPGDFDNDFDVDGNDLADLILNLSLLNLSTFADEFGRIDCP
jgi:mannobiose 2-epimerase